MRCSTDREQASRKPCSNAAAAHQEVERGRHLLAHQTNVRFSKQGGGIDVVLVDTDAAGVMGPRSEPAIRIPEVPNPF
jgi:hypothetical protein